jgi:ferrochelatase
LGTASAGSAPGPDVPSYDAVLVVSFGGPEGMADVQPFLEHVGGGRNVPPERLREVAEHYAHFGGVSPINAQNRALIAALAELLAAEGPALPIYWGNRNWHPYLADTLGRMAADGIRRALAFVTSAYSSYSSCRQYLEDIARARAAVGPGAPEVDKLRAYYNHPGFIEPNVAHLRAAVERIPPERRLAARVAFTAHSIPLTMAAGCAYEAQLQEACRLVAAGACQASWRLAYQSRSGRPGQAWLEPDILEHLTSLHAAGARDVVVAPIGFISDHLEVRYDLDWEARRHCHELGLNMVRAASAGVHPAFIRMIRELILERLAADPERRWLGTDGPSHDVCPSGCCPRGTAHSEPARRA